LALQACTSAETRPSGHFAKASWQGYYIDDRRLQVEWGLSRVPPLSSGNRSRADDALSGLEFMCNHRQLRNGTDSAPPWRCAHPDGMGPMVGAKRVYRHEFSVCFAKSTYRYIIHGTRFNPGGQRIRGVLFYLTRRYALNIN
jgi:hypothetical protein